MRLHLTNNNFYLSVWTVPYCYTVRTFKNYVFYISTTRRPAYMDLPAEDSLEPKHVFCRNVPRIFVNFKIILLELYEQLVIMYTRHRHRSGILTQPFNALSLYFSNICFSINVLSASSSCKWSSLVNYKESEQTSVIRCIRCWLSFDRICKQ